MDHTPSLACDPNAISAEQQGRWIQLSKLVYGAFEEVRELPDGYAARLPNRADMLALLAEDLNLERLCCPFLRFVVEVEPNNGPIWVRYTGPAGTKDFLRMGFESADLIEPGVARAAGLSTAGRRDVSTVPNALATVDMVNERFAASTRARSTSSPPQA